MNDRRRAKFEEVAAKSQLSLTVILENVHDPLNIGAILRSCDSVGIRKIFVINDTGLKQHKTLTLGKRSSMGTRKWVDVRYFHDLESCIAEVRKEFDNIVGAAICDNTINHLDFDFTGKVAILMGNEKNGLSQKAIEQCDALIQIPQVGMAESLNVSTATAVILYEAFRQRYAIGKYGENPDITSEEAGLLLNILNDKVYDRTRSTKKFKIKPEE